MAKYLYTVLLIDGSTRVECANNLKMLKWLLGKNTKFLVVKREK